MSIQQSPPHQVSAFRALHDAEPSLHPLAKPQLPKEYHAAVTEELLARARDYCPEKFSCRHFKVDPRNPRLIAGLLIVFAAIFMFPMAILLALMSWIMLANLSVTVLRISAIIATKRRKDIPSFLTEKGALAPLLPPRVTLLVPLFKEENVLPALIKNLKALDYPRDFLEIKLLLEEVDIVTQTTLKNITLPDFIDVVTIPKDWLQTKPKAMNYALPFCTGDIIGIYDAEDCPEPNQISKIVNHFMTAPANVACVQGNLDFFNSRDNWMSRCFTIDYAMWFQVLFARRSNPWNPHPSWRDHHLFSPQNPDRNRRLGRT